MLLYDVGQLMSEELFAFKSARGIATRRKDDVPPDRIGQRIDRVGRCRCDGIGMDAHLAKIMMETRFEEAARLTIERQTL